MPPVSVSQSMACEWGSAAKKLVLRNRKYVLEYGPRTTAKNGIGGTVVQSVPDHRDAAANAGRYGISVANLRTDVCEALSNVRGGRRDGPSRHQH